MRHESNLSVLAKETGDSDSKFGFLQDIRLITWGMINGPLHVWYHECGEYYQIEVDCELLDGWGDAFQATLHMVVEKKEPSLVERYRQEYQVGSVHRIECSTFSFQKSIVLYSPIHHRCLD